MLFVEKKMSGDKPSVSLRWVCLVLLSLGGHSSSYSLYWKHRGFVPGCYRLPLLWWCHVFFSQPVSKGPEAWSLTVPSVWDWHLSPFPPVCLDSPYAFVAEQSIYSCIASLHI